MLQNELAADVSSKAHLAHYGSFLVAGPVDTHSGNLSTQPTFQGSLGIYLGKHVDLIPVTLL
jgi:hypothetical protein